MWDLRKCISVGGVTAVGIDRDSQYLVVVSHSGRGVFDLATFDRVARDYSVEGDWYLGVEAEGLGPVAGVKVPIFGINSPTPREILDVIPGNTEEHLTEFKGTAISPDGKWLCVAYGDEIQVFEKTEW